MGRDRSEAALSRDGSVKRCWDAVRRKLSSTLELCRNIPPAIKSCHGAQDAVAMTSGDSFQVADSRSKELGPMTTLGSCSL